MNELLSRLTATQFSRAVLVCSVVTGVAVAAWLWLVADIVYRQDASFAVYRTPNGVTAISYASNVTRSSWVVRDNPCGPKAEVKLWKPWLTTSGLACVENGISEEELGGVAFRLNVLALRETALRYGALVLPLVMGALMGLSVAVAANLSRLIGQWIKGAPD